MSGRILVFSGTSDGSALALALARRGWQVTVSTATEYGRRCTASHENITVLSGRLDGEQMTALLQEQSFDAVADATHPYAAEVSRQLRAACQRAGLPYHRLLREKTQTGQVVEVESTQQAAEFLKTTEGNVLLTTGSKELAAYTCVPDYRTRLYARVLSTLESVQAGQALGFEGKNLIAMQGPFTEEMNIAMLRQIQASWLVTKDSGVPGGTEEKLQAAQKAGARVVLIRRPQEEQGESLNALLLRLTGRPAQKTVYLVGIGMGERGGMTVEAAQAIARSGLLIGAERMLQAADCSGKVCVKEYRTDEIVRRILEAEQTEIAVLLSGDIGFYSGAKALRQELERRQEITVQPICGISSVVYLCGKLGVSWDDAVLVSLHGRQNNLAGLVQRHAKVFAITGKNTGELLQQLQDCGLGQVQVSIGENLSYPNERIRTGTVESLCSEEIQPLCALLLQNPQAVEGGCTPGLPDEAFLRDKAPMTKEEVRSISLCKLRLQPGSVVYDVGAGTGSVSVEAARLAYRGRVYAIERKDDACRLIGENCRHFGLANVEVVPGLAPEALEGLEPPTHVFIGGSGGNMEQIVACVLKKNPRARIVINTIAMESTQEAMALLKKFPVEQTDVVVLNVARAKTVGTYHMMMGCNPVTVISFTGKGEAT